MPPGGRMGGPIMRGFATEEEKAAAPKVTKELLKRVFSYLAPYWKQLLLVLLAIALSSVLNLMPAILTGKIIDEGLIGKDLRLLIIYIAALLLTNLGANLIGVLESYINTWIAQHITFDMRNQMYGHLQSMSQRFFTSNNQGDIITRMTSDIDGVESVVTNTFKSILSNAITLVFAIIAMFQKNWILALLGIAVIPLFVIPTRKAGKTRWTLTREAQECNDEINGILNEKLSVSGQLLVKLFCKEKPEMEHYRTANEKMVKLNIKERMAGRWFFVVLNTVTNIGPMLLYLVGGILIMKYESSLT
ncbi:MAG: ABC transporter ATP-binding protein, partial [Lachnospiraceae bacterium]|nr:ABC transporter ATP-binding protein [Lachnospiraceae bacterium]